ncbi:polysaccharide deacetylase family protein [Bacillus cereus]|uniref:polysaccharide deacetylase family protein n=1 Tax=Bacillus cereus TaxID=1396 RepID=UPI00355621A3|nr:polysaccharide deacetylase family protein [Bacillus cereus]
MKYNKFIEDAKIGSAPGWPLVLYFHHVHPKISHYTSLNPDDFSYVLDTVLEYVGSPLDPNCITADFQSWLPKEPTVLITFDDGYKDNIEYALPVLEKFGVLGMFFIIGNKIGLSIDEFQNPRNEYLSWSELEHLDSMGHVIGAHTMTHANLEEIEPTNALFDILYSINFFKKNLPTNPVHFAYPYGKLPDIKPVFPQHTLAFGTVKASPCPWDEKPYNIRRTYVPTGEKDRWITLARGWREQWFESQL